MPGLILLVFAFVFFCIGIFAVRNPNNSPETVPWHSRFSFVSAGLAAWTLAELISRWPK